MELLGLKPQGNLIVVWHTLEKRRADFELANSYAKKDEIFCAGVQAATILELIIRKTYFLRGCKT